MEHAVDFENEPDRPMRDDIRLLGRLLGDTVREQEGDAAFEMVEGVRQSARSPSAGTTTSRPAATSSACSTA